MFKKILEVGNLQQINKSQIKSIRANVQKKMPNIVSSIDEIFPLKAKVQLIKVKSEYKTDLVSIDDQIIFIQKEDNVFPTLRLLHQYPDLLPKMQVDEGAVKFMFSGANVMSPGLTSPGGRMDDVKAQTLVGIYVEDKEHAIAIGITDLSTEQIKASQGGQAITNYHSLNDALWKYQKN